MTRATKTLLAFVLSFAMALSLCAPFASAIGVLIQTEDSPAKTPQTGLLGFNYSGTNNWVTFSKTEPGTINAFASVPTNVRLATLVDDVVYYATDAGNSSMFCSFDLTTGVYTEIAKSNYLNMMLDLTYDSTTDQFYACSTGLLFTINRTTGASSIIGYTMDFSAIACVDGVLYGIDEDMVQLRIINKTNGASTAVSDDSTGIRISSGPMSMVYSPEEALFYFAAYNSGDTTSKLYTFDKETGAVSFIGQIGENDRMVGLCLLPTDGIEPPPYWSPEPSSDPTPTPVIETPVKPTPTQQPPHTEDDITLEGFDPDQGWIVFDPNTPESFMRDEENVAPLGMGTYTNDELDLIYFINRGNLFCTYNTITKDTLENMIVDNAQSILGMTYNPVNPTVYALAERGTMIWCINPEDGSNYEGLTLDEALMTIACDDRGTIYGMSESGNFVRVTIDGTRASCETLFQMNDVNIALTEFYQTLCFDSVSGNFYAVYVDNTQGPTLLYLDLEARAAEALGFVAFGRGLSALYVKEHIISSEPTPTPATESTRLYALRDAGNMQSHWVSFLADNPSEGKIEATVPYAQQGRVADYYNGYIYTYSPNFHRLYEINAETFEYVELGEIKAPSDAPAYTIANDMAFDYSTNTFYCYVSSPAFGSHLFSYDIYTGVLKKLVDLDTNLMMMSITTDGQMYGISKDNNNSSLYRIDKNTGVCTLVGSTGLNPNYLQSMSYDHATGTMYWAYYGTTQASGRLYSIDLDTAAVTDCGALYEGSEYWCLLSMPASEDINYPVEPVAAQGMTMNYDSLKVNVGYTAQLSPIFDPADTTWRRMTYTSMDESIVTVSPLGEVRGVAQGETEIECVSSDGGFTVIVPVRVRSALEYNTMDYSTVINPPQTFDLSFTETSTLLMNPNTHSEAFGYGFSITMPRNATITFETRGSNMDIDTSMFIYDSNFTLLEYNDDSTGFYSKIEFTASKSSTYYVLISSYDSETLGDFQFTASEMSVPAQETIMMGGFAFENPELGWVQFATDNMDSLESFSVDPLEVRVATKVGDLIYFIDNGETLKRYSIADGRVGEVGHVDNGGAFIDMAYDAVNDVFWGTDGWQLFGFSGADASSLSVTPLPMPIVSIATNENGSVYAICGDDGGFYQIEPRRGEMTLQFSTGLRIGQTGMQDQPLCYDPDTSLFYTIISSRDGMMFYEINTTTSSAILLGTILNNVKISGLFVKEHVQIVTEPVELLAYTYQNEPGFVTLSPDDPATLTEFSTIPRGLRCATINGNTIYFIQETDGSFWTYDCTTGALTMVNPQMVHANEIMDMEYDPDQNCIWAIGMGGQFFSIAPNSGTANMMGNFGENVVAIAKNDEGVFYGVTEGGYLCTIDLRRIAVTPLAEHTGIRIGGGMPMSMTYDSESTAFYFAVVDSRGNYFLYSIASESGAATELGAMRKMLTGLMIKPEGIVPPVLSTPTPEPPTPTPEPPTPTPEPPTPTPEPPTPTPEHIYGDANMDGVMNTGDVACILRYLIHLIEESQIDLYVSDVNNDTFVNSGDAALLLEICLN